MGGMAAGQGSVEEVAAGGRPWPDDRALLEEFAHAPERAWREFLERYSLPMLRWLQRRENDVDAARDRYTETLERLAAGDYRRLRGVALDASRPTLWPWLQAVMNAGAINALWARFGRLRPSARVRELGVAEQLLYPLWVETGGQPMATVALAARRHPGRDPGAWLLAFERLQQSLDARERGRLLALHLRRRTRHDEAALEGLVDPGAGPAAHAELAQLDAALRAALARLEPRVRLALQLRFEQELPHAAIGAVLGTGESGARHLLREALERLRLEMST